MIPIEEAKIRGSSKSHAGLAGKKNQDRFTLQAFQLKESASEEAMLAILADGVGGQKAGEIAAQLAVDVIYDTVAQSQGSQPSGILQAAFLRAGQAIVTQGESESGKRGMGSTALCAWVIGKRLYSASVGNSRLYLLRGDRFELLNELTLVGDIAEDEAGDANEDDYSGSSFLGSRIREDVELSYADSSKRRERERLVTGTPLRSNDRILLCSDGLFEALTEEEMRDILAQARIEDAASNLVQAALEKEAQANLTALAIAIPPGRPIAAYQKIAVRRRATLALASLLLVISTLLGWFFLAPQLDPSTTPEPTAINTLTPAP